MVPSVMAACSALWFASAWVFHATNRNSKDGVFGAPVWALAVLVLMPLAGVILAAYLFRERWEKHEPLRPIDYCGLLAGALPFLFVAALVLITLASR